MPNVFHPLENDRLKKKSTSATAIVTIVAIIIVLGALAYFCFF